MTNINVFRSGITSECADVLIATISSDHAWTSEVNAEIEKAGGPEFHQQAAMKAPLCDGDTVFAKGRSNTTFLNVIFVVDDNIRPLREIIRLGLDCAAKNGMKSVLLPIPRLGDKRSRGLSVEEAVREASAGIREFVAEWPVAFEDISFVMVRWKNVRDMLTASLRTH